MTELTMQPRYIDMVWHFGHTLSMVGFGDFEDHELPPGVALKCETCDTVLGQWAEQSKNVRDQLVKELHSEEDYEQKLLREMDDGE